MFSLTGRIDASNVEQWEEKLFAQQEAQVAEVYYVLAKVLPEQALVKAAGVGKEMCEKIWNYVIEHYFDVAMEKSKLVKVLTSYATLNMLAAVKFQIFPKEIVPALKNILFSCQEQEYEMLSQLTNTSPADNRMKY